MRRRCVWTGGERAVPAFSGLAWGRGPGSPRLPAGTRWQWPTVQLTRRPPPPALSSHSGPQKKAPCACIAFQTCYAAEASIALHNTLAASTPQCSQWVAPEQIRSMDTAPQLPETWGRLALTPGQEEALGELAADRSRGAAELAAAAVAALQGEAAALAAAGAHAALAAAGPAARPAAAGGHAGARAAGPAGFAAEPAVGPAAAAAAPADGGGAAFTALRNYGWHLAACRPSMAAVANSVAAVLAAAHEELHSRWVGGVMGVFWGGWMDGWMDMGGRGRTGWTPACLPASAHVPAFACCLAASANQGRVPRLPPACL